MQLPQFSSTDLSFNLLQTRWAAALNPVIGLPQVNSVILNNIILSSSSVINHTLGRNLVGWQVIRQRGDAAIYDRQDINQTPENTLLLTSSSGVSVDLLCF